LEKLDYYKYKDEIENSRVIFSFQRLATSGHSVDFVQPFRNNEFIFMHNGVMNSFLKDKGSDSWGFFQDFKKKFEESVGKDRTERFINTIQELFRTANYGWYSIIFYDLVDRCLYYFKNDRPSIYFYGYGDIVYITTNSENKVFLPLLGKGRLKTFEVENNFIYKLVPLRKKVKIFKLQEIEINKEEDIDITDEFTKQLIMDDFCSNCGIEIKDGGYIIEGMTWCENCQGVRNCITGEDYSIHYKGGRENVKEEKE
jgi:hypothetical protein